MAELVHMSILATSVHNLFKKDVQSPKHEIFEKIWALMSRSKEKLNYTAKRKNKII